MLWKKITGCPHYGKKDDGSPRTQTPRCIILHYTSGSFVSARSWFLHQDSYVSSHLLIERDGGVNELFAPEYVTWHAGDSTWRERRWCNGFSYGIELVAENEAEDSGLRFTFTEAQYGTLREILWGTQAEGPFGLADRFGLTAEAAGTPDADILGHEHVSPGRKSDPGPLFDWSQIAQLKASRPVPTEVPEQPVEITEQLPVNQSIDNTSLFVKLLVVIQRILGKLKRDNHVS